MRWRHPSIFFSGCYEVGCRCRNVVSLWIRGPWGKCCSDTIFSVGSLVFPRIRLHFFPNPSWTFVHRTSDFTSSPPINIVGFHPHLTVCLLRKMGGIKQAIWPPTSLYIIYQLVFLVLLTVRVDAQITGFSNCVPEMLKNESAFNISRCEALYAPAKYYLGFTEDVEKQSLKIVLAVPRLNSWFGIGFNDVPEMLGIECVLGWLNETSREPKMGQYFLTSYDGSGVESQDRLKFVVEPRLIPAFDTYYMTFEINTTTSTISRSHTIFAIGIPNNVPDDTGFTNRIVEHQEEITTVTNFQTGVIRIVSSNLRRKAAAHGVLNIVGWGVLLPIGVIIARYAKGYDPAWFYLHAVCQVSGLAFILGGLITGFDLQDIIPSTVDDTKHKIIGILIFALASCQISALFLRPKKESNLRRFWNWEHWWIGRVALVLGAINIYVGIDIADGGSGWIGAYSAILAIELVVISILEILFWRNYFKAKKQPQLPQTTAIAMQSSYPDSRHVPSFRQNLDGR